MIINCLSFQIIIMNLRHIYRYIKDEDESGRNILEKLVILINIRII